MFALSKKYFFLAGLTFTALIVLILSFWLHPRRSPHPQLVSSQPGSGASQVSVYKPLTFQFDLPVTAANLQVNSTPPENWVIKQLNPVTISLTHSLALHPNTTYTLKLTLNHKPLTTLIFTTQTSQGDPRLVQTLQQELDRDYPLATKIPYETSQFRVVYSAPLTFEITLKSSSLAAEQAISQLKIWVKKNGVDPATHRYQVVLSSSVPASSSPHSNP